MQLAFQLLSKFKRDKNFIQKDLEQVKKQSSLVVRPDSE